MQTIVFGSGRGFDHIGTQIFQKMECVRNMVLPEKYGFNVAEAVDAFLSSPKKMSVLFLSDQDDVAATITKTKPQPASGRFNSMINRA